MSNAPYTFITIAHTLSVNAICMTERFDMPALHTQQMVTARLEPELKNEFVRIAESHKQSTSDLLRKLIQRYVDETHEKELVRQTANIRANAAEEDEVMHWIAAYGVNSDD